jgi:hypothetical protein
MAMTFKEYIAGINAGGFAMGHFVLDAQGDPELPDAESWEELEAYLVAKKAKAEAEVLKGAREYWSFFEEQARRP